MSAEWFVDLVPSVVENRDDSETFQKILIRIKKNVDCRMIERQ